MCKKYEIIEENIVVIDCELLFRYIK